MELELAQNLGVMDGGAEDDIPLVSPRQQKAKAAAMRTLRGGLGGKGRMQAVGEGGAEDSEVKRRLLRYINARAKNPDDASLWEPVVLETVPEAAELTALLNSSSEALGLFEVHVALPPDTRVQYKFFSGLSNQNTFLKSLCLGGSELNPAGAQLLATFIARTTTISNLSVPDCSISSEGVFPIVDAMLHNESITKLDLSSNRIAAGHGCARILAKMIRQDVELETLILANNQLDDKGIVDLLLAINDREAKQCGAIAQGIALPKIKATGGAAGTVIDHSNVGEFLLDVRDNLLVADETALLASTLLVKSRVLGVPLVESTFGEDRSKYQALQEDADKLDLQSKHSAGARRVATVEEALKLASELIGEKATVGKVLLQTTVKKSDRSLILEGFVRAHSWHSLDLSGNNLAARAESLMLSNELSDLSTLKKLDLSRCALGRDACVALETILRSNSSLQYLDVSFNTSLTSEGVQHLFEGLKKARKLSHFTMTDCKLSIRSAKLIGEMLTLNKTLVYLDVSRNLFGPDGGSLIVRHLNQTLVTLKMSKCKFKLAGLTEVLNLVNGRKSALSVLDVSHNGFRGTIAASLDKNFTLLDLNLGLPLPTELAEALRRNRDARKALDDIVLAGGASAPQQVEKVMSGKNVGLGVDGEGNTLLHLAARKADAPVVVTLTDNALVKLQIDTPDAQGDTALHIAARNGHVDVCRTLVSDGADVMIRNSEGKLAEDLVSNKAAFRGVFSETSWGEGGNDEPLSALKLWDDDRVLTKGKTDVSLSYPSHPWNYIGDAPPKQYQRARFSQRQMTIILDVVTFVLILLWVYESFEIPFRWGFQPVLPGGYFALALAIDTFFLGYIVYLLLGHRTAEEIDPDKSEFSFAWGRWKKKSVIATAEKRQNRRKALMKQNTFFALIFAAFPFDYITFILWCSYSSAIPGLALDILQAFRFLRLFILLRSQAQMQVVVGALNIGWWVIDLCYMAFYFFFLVQVAACLYYFEGRYALQLGYNSWLSSYDFLGIDMVAGPIWDRYGATYYGFVIVATGDTLDVTNGLEAFIMILTLLGLALVFTAYIFGIIIDRIAQLAEKKRSLQDTQDQIVEYCSKLGLPDKIERQVVAKFMQMSEADVPTSCESVGDMMHNLSRDLNNEIALAFVHASYEGYQKRLKEDEKSLASDGETEWGLRKEHLNRKGDVSVVHMPPSFPFTHYMFTLLRKLCFHPKRYAAFIVSLMKKMEKDFFVDGSKIFYFQEGADDVFQILEGQVTLHIGRVRGGGKQSFRVKLGPGDFFGWEALLKGDQARVTEAKCVGNVVVWRYDASVLKKQVGKDDDLKRDLYDAWLTNMRDTVRDYTLLYFAPDLTANKLMSDAPSKEIAESVLIGTMTSKPEVVRKEKKTLEDRIKELEELLVESNARHNEQIVDLKLEISGVKAEMNKHFAELARLIRDK